MERVFIQFYRIGPTSFHISLEKSPGSVYLESPVGSLEWISNEICQIDIADYVFKCIRLPSFLAFELRVLKWWISERTLMVD